LGNGAGSRAHVQGTRARSEKELMAARIRLSPTALEQAPMDQWSIEN
jgi:hypothetical protein